MELHTHFKVWSKLCNVNVSFCDFIEKRIAIRSLPQYHLTKRSHLSSAGSQFTADSSSLFSEPCVNGIQPWWLIHSRPCCLTSHKHRLHQQDELLGPLPRVPATHRHRQSQYPVCQAAEHLNVINYTYTRSATLQGCSVNTVHHPVFSWPTENHLKVIYIAQ